MNIDRCYCYDQTFAHLKAIADETGASSIETLQEHVTFGDRLQVRKRLVVAVAAVNVHGETVEMWRERANAFVARKSGYGSCRRISMCDGAGPTVNRSTASRDAPRTTTVPADWKGSCTSVRAT